MRRLRSLTDQQRALIPRHADEWIARFVDPGPTDHGSVEHGLRRCYEYAGIPWHRLVIWTPNPLVGAIAGRVAASLMSIDQDEPTTSVARLLHSAVVRTVDTAVRARVGRIVTETVRGTPRRAADGQLQLVDGVDTAIHGVTDGIMWHVHGAMFLATSRAIDRAIGYVHDGVRAGMADDPLADAVNRAVGGALGDIHGRMEHRWPAYADGLAWGSWLPYISYYRRIGLELPGDLWDRYEAYEKALEALWIWPYRHYAVVSEKWIAPPAIEQVGPRGHWSHRPHAPRGPALRFEGWDIYSLHGRLVDWSAEEAEMMTLDEAWPAD
jgi:hypothetical protein